MESSASETVSVSTLSSGKEDPPGSSGTSRRSDGSEGLVEESLPSREELNQGLNTLQRRVCALSEPRGQMMPLPDACFRWVRPLQQRC